MKQDKSLEEMLYVFKRMIGFGFEANLSLNSLFLIALDPCPLLECIPLLCRVELLWWFFENYACITNLVGVFLRHSHFLLSKSSVNFSFFLKIIDIKLQFDTR